MLIRIFLAVDRIHRLLMQTTYTAYPLNHPMVLPVNQARSIAISKIEYPCKFL